MARTSYLAPGVYVEEIPSARQPIAGVGTNTVGFIGIVPDKIYCPVPNPDYDPVAAQAATTLAALTAQQAALAAEPKADEMKKADIAARIAAAKDELQTKLDNAAAQLKELGPDLDAAQKDEAEKLKAAQDADDALRAKSEELNKLSKDDRDKRKDELAG